MHCCSRVDVGDRKSFVSVKYDTIRHCILVLQVWDGLRRPMTGERLAHPRPPSAALYPASTARPRHPSAAPNPASTARPRHPSAALPSPPSAAQTRPILDMCRPTKHILLPPNLLIPCYLFLVFFKMFLKNTKIAFVILLFSMFPYRFALFFF
jgi:hypothetical protein